MESFPRGDHGPDEAEMKPRDWCLYCSNCGWQGPPNTAMVNPKQHEAPNGDVCLDPEARIWTVPT